MWKGQGSSSVTLTVCDKAEKAMWCWGGGVKALMCVNTISFVTSGFGGRCPPGGPLQTAGLWVQGGCDTSLQAAAITRWGYLERSHLRGGQDGGTQWGTECSGSTKNEEQCL